MALPKLTKREPALIAGAIVALLNVLVALGVVDLNAEQLSGVNVALTAVLSWFVRSRVTPNEPA